MTTPAPDEAPASAGWKLRAATMVVLLVATLGAVLGMARAAEAVMNALDSLRGFHLSPRLVPVPIVADASPVSDASDDPPPAPVAIQKPRRRPIAAPEDVPIVDAGVDAGRDDTARVLVKEGFDAGRMRRGSPTPRVPCSVDLPDLVGSRYAAVTSYQATFDQELRVRALGSVSRSHGTAVFTRSGKMSWSYDEPENSRIVSDGATVAVYEGPTKRLFRVPARNSPYPGAFVFLTAPVPLADLLNFKVARTEETPTYPSMCLLTGTPKGFTRAFRRVTWAIDRETLDVVRVVIVDSAGDENRIDLINPSVDAPVDPDAFTFVPPIDTIVVGR